MAKVAGLALRVDPGLEEQIEAVSRMVAERMKRPYADFSDGVTKQATVPEPSAVLGLAGTAPGLVVEAGGTPVVILPGPPTELRRLWPRALETDEVRRVLDRGTPPLRRTLRFFGPGESQVAQAFHEAGGDGDGLEVTICARELRDPRRPRRGAGGGAAADRARRRALEAPRPLSLLDRRAQRRGARARPLPRAAAGRSPPPSRARAGSSPPG